MNKEQLRHGKQKYIEDVDPEVLEEISKMRGEKNLSRRYFEKTYNLRADSLDAYFETLGLSKPPKVEKNRQRKGSTVEETDLSVIKEIIRLRAVKGLSLHFFVSNYGIEQYSLVALFDTLGLTKPIGGEKGKRTSHKSIAESDEEYEGGGVRNPLDQMHRRGKSHRD
ncbi:MAG: hypothetical protein ABI758_04020 [Candidatus Woesebacteria bacterium]